MSTKARYEREDLDSEGPARHCGFFFQAEDGIRDYKVTGVQTCALPISVTLGSTGWWVVSTATTGATTARTSTRPGSTGPRRQRSAPPPGSPRGSRLPSIDRKSVVWGKSVDLGGRRIIKKKKNKEHTYR